MARFQQAFHFNGAVDVTSAKNNGLGVSSTGDFVVEVDLAKVTKRSQLLNILGALQAELLGLVSPI